MNKQSIFIAVAAVLLLGLAAWFIWPWCKGREQNATAPLIKQQPEIRGNNLYRIWIQERGRYPPSLGSG